MGVKMDKYRRKQVLAAVSYLAKQKNYKLEHHGNYVVLKYWELMYFRETLHFDWKTLCTYFIHANELKE